MLQPPRGGCCSIKLCYLTTLLNIMWGDSRWQPVSHTRKKKKKSNNALNSSTLIGTFTLQEVFFSSVSPPAFCFLSALMSTRWTHGRHQSCRLMALILCVISSFCLSFFLFTKCLVTASVCQPFTIPTSVRLPALSHGTFVRCFLFYFIFRFWLGRRHKIRSEWRNSLCNRNEWNINQCEAAASAFMITINNVGFWATERQKRRPNFLRKQN